MNILIFGASFSGSTLLSSLLGGHSKIMTFGELAQWYLWQLPARDGYFSRRTLGTMHPQLATCRECGDKCETWGSAPVPDSPTQLYAKLRRYFNARYIVDSSKHPHWYEKIVPECPGDKFIAVVLHKPVWSIVTSRARYRKLASSGQLPRADALAEIGFWCYFYRGFRRILREHTIPSVNLRYEELARQPEIGLRRALDLIDLEYEPQQLDGINMPLHQIAGNGKLRTRVMASGRKLGVTYDAGVDEAPRHVRQMAVDHMDARELMIWLGREAELP